MTDTSAFPSLINRIISESFSSLLTAERQARIAQIGKAWDFYYGDQEKYVKQYRGEDDDDYQDKDKPTFNYTAGVVDEYVNGVFGKPVLVDFENEKDQDIWDEIVSPMRFKQQLPFMKKVQRVAEISETCVVMLRFDRVSKRTYFEEIRGEYVTFIPNKENPREIGALIIAYIFDTGDPDPNKRLLKRIEIWDDEKWEVWLYSHVLRKRKKIGAGKNPYKFIPAVRFVPEEDDNTFYGISNIFDVVKVNEIYNNLWTALVRICIFQSFSILVVKSSGELKLTLAPTRFLKFENVDENADANYITPSPNIDSVEKVLMDLKRELQDFSKVPAAVLSQTGASSPQSGYALRIKRIPIEQVWESRRLSYGPAYQNLAQMAVVVDQVNKYNLENAGSLNEHKVKVSFTDTVPGLDPQEQIVQDNQEMRYNLITPVDLMIRKFPNLTREEAAAKIEENRKEMQELGFAQFDEGLDRDLDKQNLKNAVENKKIEDLT